MTRRAAALLLVLSLAALGASACGLGGGSDGAEQVGLRVTESFGTDLVKGLTEPSVPRGDTVMRFLQRSADVGTRYGGTFVQEIDGRAGGRQDGRPVDWFYYVNGIEAEVGAAERGLSPGDRVWWDLHDWGAAMRVPAVVGSFPEPFLSGSGGKRIPVRIECAEPETRECDEVAERLDGAGVKSISRSVLSQRDAGGLVRVLVGVWRDLRLDPTALRVERGPQKSGIYARFDASGRRLDVLDPRGRVARTLGAGAGLVAATRQGEAQPVWLVTGTDSAGLAAAAAALDEDVLRQRFAVTIENGQASPVPPPATGGLGG